MDIEARSGSNILIRCTNLSSCSLSYLEHFGYYDEKTVERSRKLVLRTHFRYKASNFCTASPSQREKSSLLRPEAATAKNYQTEKKYEVELCHRWWLVGTEWAWKIVPHPSIRDNGLDFWRIDCLLRKICSCWVAKATLMAKTTMFTHPPLQCFGYFQTTQATPQGTGYGMSQRILGINYSWASRWSWVIHPCLDRLLIAWRKGSGEKSIFPITSNADHNRVRCVERIFRNWGKHESPA